MESSIAVNLINYSYINKKNSKINKLINNNYNNTKLTFHILYKNYIISYQLRGTFKRYNNNKK